MKRKILSLVIHRSYLAMLAIFVLSGCELADPVTVTTHSEKSEAAPVITFGETKALTDSYIVIFEESASSLPPASAQAQSRTATSPRAFTFGNTVSKVSAEGRRDKVLNAGEEILSRHGISAAHIEKVFENSFQGILVKANQSEIEALGEDTRVAFVEQDKMIAMDMGAQIKTPFLPSGKMTRETVPYGIEKVGGSRDFANHPMNMYRWAWIVDTGIDMDHEDLEVDSLFSKNFTSDPSVDDGHGHGTHVAGVIAAKDNGIGVSGVAAGATVVAIKVLNNKGEGRISDIVAGLDWVAKHAWPDDVVNVSLGGTASLAVDRAVKRIARRGIRVVVAAGNNAEDISNFSPARVEHKNVYTVGSIDAGNAYSWFSNYGNGVDYVGPGYGILSTYKNNGYGWMTGTSMAAPHVSGVLIISGPDYSSSGTSKDPVGRQIGVIYHNE